MLSIVGEEIGEVEPERAHNLCGVAVGEAMHQDSAVIAYRDREAIRAIDV
jgi:hypothetical protein